MQQQVEILSVQMILESCIQREKLSVDLYERAGKIVGSPASRKLLAALREEETEHIRRLTEALEEGRTDLLGAAARPAPKGVSLPPREVLAITADSTPRDVLAYAVSHEEKSIDYFARYVDAFRGTRLGKLFERLRREEEAHRSKLLEELEKLPGKR